MNIHLELLAANQQALKRMRALGDSCPWLPDCEVDIQLIVAEIQRDLNRIAHWEAVVDSSERAIPLRPILAATGV